jgi:hypothetical protein
VLNVFSLALVLDQRKQRDNLYIWSRNFLSAIWLSPLEHLFRQPVALPIRHALTLNYIYGQGYCVCSASWEKDCHSIDRHLLTNPNGPNDRDVFHALASIFRTHNHYFAGRLPGSGQEGTYRRLENSSEPSTYCYGVSWFFIQQASKIPFCVPSLIKLLTGDCFSDCGLPLTIPFAATAQLQLISAHIL